MEREETFKVRGTRVQIPPLLLLCDLGEVIPTHLTSSHTMLEISRALILDDFPLFPILFLYYPLPHNSSIGQWQVEQEEVGIHLIGQTLVFLIGFVYFLVAHTGINGST